MARSLKMDTLLLTQTVLYCSLAVMGLFSIISLQTSVNELNNQCILFADLNVTSGEVNITISNDSNSCDFVVYTSGVEEFFVILLCIYHIYMFHKSKTNPDVAESLIVRPILVFVFICAVFGLILAGVTSAGYLYTTRQVSSPNLLAIRETWADPVNPQLITLNMEIAQASLWINCCLWISILAVTIIRHLHQRRIVAAKHHAAILLEHSRTNSDEILYETKTSYRS